MDKMNAMDEEWISVSWMPDTTRVELLINVMNKSVHGYLSLLLEKLIEGLWFRNLLDRHIHQYRMNTFINTGTKNKYSLKMRRFNLIWFNYWIFPIGFWKNWIEKTKYATQLCKRKNH